MRFLHTSDWHLGAQDNETNLYDDQKHFIDEICGIIADKKIDAVLLAGDVYDRSVASREAISLYDYAMKKICGDMGVSVLTVAGNHDGPERLATCSELLTKAGLHVLGIAQAEPVKVEFDDTDVYLMPWVTVQKVRSLYPDEADKIATLSDAYGVMADHMRDTFAQDKKHFVVAHAFMTRAETSTSDRAAEIGTAEQVSLSAFDGFDYVALGHIHKPQDVGANARYCGTPMAYSFGREEIQEKSVTIIDTDTMDREIVLLHPLHRRTTLTGTLEELLTADYPQDVKDGYVKLVATDSFISTESIARLRAVYPHIVEFSGKTYDGNGRVTMTMREFEDMQSDPQQIFARFCEEAMKETPTSHQTELFIKAIKETEEVE